jgi:type IV pilus assembly protein PilO
MAINRSTLSRLAPAAKAGLCAGGMLLLGAGYFFLFHSELEDSLSSAETKGGSLTQDLGKARTAEQAYQKDLAELAEREQRQKELNQILPATTEYPQFLSAVQSAANVSGVSLSAWTPREKVPGKFYARVPMKVELTGRFHQIARFFYNVGQLDRIINMENISITDPARVDDEVMLKTEALATAFHVVDAAESGKDGKDKKQDKKSVKSEEGK